MKFKVDKNKIVYKLRELVWQSVKGFAKGLKVEDIQLEHPENEKFGDYSSNIALVLAKKEGRKPGELAEEIVKGLQKTELLEKVEVAGPGFINFYLSKKFFKQEVAKILKEKDEYGWAKALIGKTILLEHTSPDPIKTMHIGHLRNNFLGMSCYRILKSLGAKLALDCINNDRGTHVSQAMLGFLAFSRKNREIAKEELLNFAIPKEKVKKVVGAFNWREALQAWLKNPGSWLGPEDLELKSDHFDLRIYAAASQALKLVPELKSQVQAILVAWEKEEKGVLELWRQIIDWSLKGYEQTYKRIGSHHDHVWHESDLYKGGKDLVYKGLEKGIFKKSQGAVVTHLVKYNLPDTVMIKKDGTSLYITFDINLTKQKKEKFPSDLYIWDIGSDQKLYLQQMFAVSEQLGLAKKEELFHLNYGFVYLKGKGKMSSREGTIISADDLIDLLVKKAKEIREKSAKAKLKKEDFDEAVALGALKYALLKNSRSTDIYFDIEESVSLEGNSGPYLQYTHARCQSILGKAGSKIEKTLDFEDLNVEELNVVRALYKFPEVVLEAGEKFSPNILCSFLYELATRFNVFYHKHRILKAKEGQERAKLRLVLTASVAQVLKSGLELLGIEALEKM